MKNLYRTTLTVLSVLLTFSSFSLPALNSYPSASATIYLDFDGENVNSIVWNGSTAFTCAPAPMTDAQITEVFNRVSEDYRPFNINITTDLQTYLAAPLAQRIRVIVTPTSSWYTGVGGVSYVGSFIWGDDTPCFVFCDRLGNKAKMVAECCSHESGHTLGLTHQSKYDDACKLTATYNDGIGSGEEAWAPIMGNSYYRNMSGWNNGPTPYGCSYMQDNLTIITTKNGFSYRKDDYADDFAAANIIDATNVNANGIISTNTDRDFFKIQIVNSANFLIDVNPYSIAAGNEGADLDVKLSLYNKDKQLLRVYNPENNMSVTIDTILSAGEYYIAVEGTGNSYTSDYGSLGSYTIKGLAKVLPIRSVSLKGINEKSKHDLSWKIIADEAIKSVEIEASADGIYFNSLAVLNGYSADFSYLPNQRGRIYYRLKATSVLNQVMYSNTVVLSNVNGNGKSFTVSTIAAPAFSVNAAEKFRYIITDVNGRTLSKGNGMEGLNKIDIGRQPAGMYILQLAGASGTQTERIIRQ
ncbi:MAG: T9SS type A sorting domain-containing protein [Ferruginibacter sp.]